MDRAAFELRMRQEALIGWSRLQWYSEEDRDRINEDAIRRALDNFERFDPSAPPAPSVAKRLQRRGQPYDALKEFWYRRRQEAYRQFKRDRAAFRAEQQKYLPTRVEGEAAILEAPDLDPMRAAMSQEILEGNTEQERETIKQLMEGESPREISKAKLASRRGAQKLRQRIEQEVAELESGPSHQASYTGVKSVLYGDDSDQDNRETWTAPHRLITDIAQLSDTGDESDSIDAPADLTSPGRRGPDIMQRLERYYLGGKRAPRSWESDYFDGWKPRRYRPAKHSDPEMQQALRNVDERKIEIAARSRVAGHSARRICSKEHLADLKQRTFMAALAAHIAGPDLDSEPAAAWSDLRTSESFSNWMREHHDSILLTGDAPRELPALLEHWRSDALRDLVATA